LRETALALFGTFKQLHTQIRSVFKFHVKSCVEPYITSYTACLFYYFAHLMFVILLRAPHSDDIKINQCSRWTLISNHQVYGASPWRHASKSYSIQQHHSLCVHMDRFHHIHSPSPLTFMMKSFLTTNVSLGSCREVQSV
jgi:hypothetical protein